MASHGDRRARRRLIEAAGQRSRPPEQRADAERDRSPEPRPRRGGGARYGSPERRAGDAARPKAARAWATSELAMRVSGRVDVLLAVRLDAASSAWARTTSRLLAGGYLGTAATVVGVDVEELAAAEAPLETAGGLRPVSIDEARELVWGAFAWSLARGLDDGDLPALGALPEPPGAPEDWEDAFEARFFAEQLELADELAELARDRRGPSVERPDAPADVRFACETAAAPALAAELHRHPSEWSYDAETQSFAWHPPGAEHGAARIFGSRVECLALSARSAARMATRLEELAPDELRLVRASFSLHEVELSRALSTRARRR